VPGRFRLAIYSATILSVLFASPTITIAQTSSTEEKENIWYKIGYENKCEHDTSPAKLILSQRRLGGAYSTSDVRDPASGRIVETTIMLQNLGSKITFYRGLTRCKTASAAAQARAAQVEKSIIDDYGDPVEQKPASPQEDAPPADPLSRSKGLESPSATESTLENRLKALRSQKRQSGDRTVNLSPAQRGAINAKVRECWTNDASVQGLDPKQVMLLVTVDNTGIARMAQVAPEDQSRLSDPRFRAFVERAVRAVLDPRCAQMPIPPSQIQGRNSTLKFRFSP
jgi:hypothetical protein